MEGSYRELRGESSVKEFRHNTKDDAVSVELVLAKVDDDVKVLVVVEDLGLVAAHFVSRCYSWACLRVPAYRETGPPGVVVMLAMMMGAAFKSRLMEGDEKKRRNF